MFIFKKIKGVMKRAWEGLILPCLELLKKAWESKRAQADFINIHDCPD